MNNRMRQQSPKRQARKVAMLVIGMDLGDRTSKYCVLDGDGEIRAQGSVSTTKKAMAAKFAGIGRCRIAVEVGTHSPWVSRLLNSLGHEVIVANARQVQLISASSRKDDRMDAETLGRLARVDPGLLRPVQHRSEEAQMALMVIRVRAGLVEARSKLVNMARGLSKSVGERLPSCSTAQMGMEQVEEVPEGLQEVLRPVMEEVASLTEKIGEHNRKIEQMAEEQYPETELLKQVSGVGTLIALTFLLTVESKERFEKSRDVGCFVGLRPKRGESGQRQPELRITKEGDTYMRKLLVQGAHYILSRFGPDTDLKRWGMQLAAQGRKNAKKRAVVAVARKLAVLLHRLWVTGEVYEPLRNSQAKQSEVSTAA